MEPTDARAGSTPEPGASGPADPSGSGSFRGWVEEVRLFQAAEAEAPEAHAPRRANRLGRLWPLLVASAAVLVGGLFVIGLGAAPERGPAHQTALRGRVVDADGKPRYGAVVMVQDAPEFVVRTAADGTFRLEGASPGSRGLLVAVGIVAQEFRVEIREGGVTELGTLCYAAPPGG
jgi:hypothetical protein